MNIRIANIMDIKEIISLEDQMYEIHSKVRPDWYGNNKLSHNIIKTIIESNNEKIFIAEDDNKIFGLCIITIYEIKNHHVFQDMTIIEIDDLIVDEKYRKMGIGKKLFEEVKIYGKRIGAKFIELMVWDFNQNATEFYEHLGMKTKQIKMELKIE
jgi:ribosomal protein S18 acetylase RimI-like enzyme